jgi:Trk K+ transport system NAD-binding subunit
LGASGLARSDYDPGVVTEWLARWRRRSLLGPGGSARTADGSGAIGEPPLPAPARPPAIVHAPARRLIVCGDDPLAYRLVEELVKRYTVEVTAILPSRSSNHGPQIAGLLAAHRGRIVESERLDEDAFRAANVASADAVALVKQDDVGNLHAALQAQELNPQLRLVIRMFNRRLGQGIGRMFNDCRVLSDAQMAAPAFVSAALGEVAPVHVRLAGRTLYLAQRSEVRPADVMCAVAASKPATEPDEPILLPDESRPNDLVLAVATGERMTAMGGAEQRVGAAPLMVVGGERRLARFRRPTLPGRVLKWLRGQVRHPFGSLRSMINRKLRIATVVLLILLLVGTTVLGVVEQIPWWDAAYLTLLTSLGGADADPTDPVIEKITLGVLTVASIALLPVVTAAVVEAAVNARLALTLGRLRQPISDHVVVVGLGNVGTRVMHDLADLGVSVVVVDKDPAAKGAQSAINRGLPFIVGDASQVQTLQAASVDTCQALVLVSTDDVTNLEAVLHAHVLKPGIRVVLRLFDGDFADLVQKAFGVTASRSVSYLAAPAFAAALLEREVVGTIPVDRHVLLLAEAPVCVRSMLDGATVAQAQDVGEVRVLALVTDEGRNTVWSPPTNYVLCAGDMLTVVTTRRGLGRLLAKTGGTTREGETEPVIVA